MNNKKPKRIVKAALNAESENGIVQHEAETELTDSTLESQIETICRKVAPTYASWVKFYMDRCEYDIEKAKGEAKKSFEFQSDHILQEFLRTKETYNIQFHHFAQIFEKDPKAMVKLWLELKRIAREELENGFRVGMVLDSGIDSAFERAQLIAVRESMIEDWQPQNGIEERLIDMMALAYSLYIYWSGIAHTKTIREEKRIKEDLNRYGEWKPVYQQTADAIDQANRIADGYNRQFLRTLRQLRDLRRYTPPVIVNNGGQVNVAQQQVNITGKNAI